jgi:hypothetical protein
MAGDPFLLFFFTEQAHDKQTSQWQAVARCSEKLS